MFNQILRCHPKDAYALAVDDLITRKLKLGFGITELDLKIYRFGMVFQRLDSVFFFLEKLNIPIRYKIKSENLKNNFLIKKYYVAFTGPIESYLKKFGLVRFFNFVSVLYNRFFEILKPNGIENFGLFRNRTNLNRC